MAQHLPIQVSHSLRTSNTLNPLLAALLFGTA